MEITPKFKECLAKIKAYTKNQKNLKAYTKKQINKIIKAKKDYERTHPKTN